MNKIQNTGIYIHIPFCEKKCGYCDFYSVPNAEKQLMDDYMKALTAHFSEAFPLLSRDNIDTVYIGGGTPSYFGSKRLKSLLEIIKKKLRLSREAEITVEINPGTATQRDMKRLLRAGFNRLSIGFQSMDDGTLAKIGRSHTSAQSVEAFENARSAGFRNISADLIFGLPGQDANDVVRGLGQVLRLRPEHISFYGLKLSKGVPMYEAYAIHGALGITNDDVQADMYMAVSELLRENGYVHYEISNFARPGFESRHNMKYWTLGRYIGFGPGAHSDAGGRRYSYVSDIAAYMDGVKNAGSIIDENEEIPPEERAVEYIMLGLRTAAGISGNEYARRFRADFSRIEEKLRAFAEKGLAEPSGVGWRLTDRGFLISNAIISELLDIKSG